MNPWNSLEIAKIVIGVLTPLSVAVLGFLLSRHLKRFELNQWKNQKLLEKRIAIYDTVAPQLNQLLCFYTWIGNWKSITPDAVIQTKRDLDRTFHVYRYLFDEDVYEAFQAFSATLFETYAGAGRDARIRSAIHTPNGNRQTDCAFEWKGEWHERFAAHDRIAPLNEVQQGYEHIMSTLAQSFGVDRLHRP